MFQAARLAEAVRYQQAQPSLGRFAASRAWNPWWGGGEGLVPAEGPASDGLLGLNRMRHDVAVLDSRTGRTTFDVLAEEQAPLLRAAMAHDPEQVLDQAELVDTPDGPLRIVNKVSSATARLLGPEERALDEDDESEFEDAHRGAPRANTRGRLGVIGFDYGNDGDDDDDTDPAPAPVAKGRSKKNNNNNNNKKKKKKKKNPLPSIMSLRYTQRRWLPLGYTQTR